MRLLFIFSLYFHWSDFSNQSDMDYDIITIFKPGQCHKWNVQSHIFEIKSSFSLGIRLF